MDDPCDLEKNMDALLSELLILKISRDNSESRGEQWTNKWLHYIEDKEHEVHDLQAELNELVAKFQNARVKLNMKVTRTLKDMEVFKEACSKNTGPVEKFITIQGNDKPQQFSFEQLMWFMSNEVIGTGGFSTVYKSQISDGTIVAVKVLKDDVDDLTQEQFIAEMHTLSKTCHENIVKLLGFCFDTRKKALVYEYMESGSLDSILYDKHHPVEWRKLYDIAIGIAKGLSYLHESCSVTVIHRDIKAANVLLDSNLSPSISGFGISMTYEKSFSHVKQLSIHGTRGYMAPEVFMGSLEIDCRCDIYSFGILLFEILQRKRISEDEDWFPEQFWKNFEEGQLEEILKKWDIKEEDKHKAKVLSRTALWCTQFMPQDRPAMSTVAKVLEDAVLLPSPPNPYLLLKHMQDEYMSNED